MKERGPWTPRRSRAEERRRLCADVRLRDLVPRSSRSGRRGQGPERDGGTDALSPPRTNFRDSETGELTCLPRPAPLLRRQLIVDDSGQGAPPRCPKSSSAPIPAAGRIDTRRYKHPSCGRLTLSGRGKASINGHLAYMLRPAAVLRSGHSLSRPPHNVLRGQTDRLSNWGDWLGAGACYHTIGSGGICKGEGFRVHLGH